MNPDMAAAVPLAGGTAANEQSLHRAAAAAPSVPPRAPAVDAAAAILEGAWAVVVLVGPGPNGLPRHRRSVYLTATAAQRAVEAARARGQRAEALLVELHPVTEGGGA